MGDPRAIGNRSTLIRFAIVRGVRAATFALASRATNWEEEAYHYRRRRRRRRRRRDIIELLVLLPIAPVPAQLVPVSGPRFPLGALRVARRGYNRRCTRVSPRSLRIALSTTYVAIAPGESVSRARRSPAQ